MKKTIIGFIGDHNSGRTTAANIMKRKGFHRASINEKVEEFALHLFSEDELSRQDRNVILNRVRRMGCSKCKEYWFNLILITIPDDKNYIIFDDLSIDEASSTKIKVYQIYRPGVSTIQLPDFETIVNDGTVKDLTLKIEEICKKLLGKK